MRALHLESIFHRGSSGGDPRAARVSYPFPEFQVSVGQVLAEISDPLPSNSFFNSRTPLAGEGMIKTDCYTVCWVLFVPCLHDCLDESTNPAGSILPILQIKSQSLCDAEPSFEFWGYGVVLLVCFLKWGSGFNVCRSTWGPLIYQEIKSSWLLHCFWEKQFSERKFVFAETRK